MRCTRIVLRNRMEVMEYLGEVRKLKTWEREDQSGLGQPNRGKLKEKGINQSAMCRLASTLVWILCVGVCVCDGVCKVSVPPWAAASYFQLPATWGRLGLTGSYWSDWVSEPSHCWIHILSMYEYFTQTFTLTSQRWDRMGCGCSLCVCRVSSSSVDLDAFLYQYIHVCVPVCLQEIHILSLYSWDLWCGSVAVSPLPGCWIWCLPSNIFKPLEMQLCICNKFGDLSIQSQTLEAWRGYYIVMLCLISSASQIWGKEGEKEVPLDSPARQMDKGAFLFSWMIPSTIAGNSLWCKRKDNKNIMQRKFSD